MPDLRPTLTRPLYLAAGTFGSGVVERMREHLPGDVQDVSGGTHPSSWPYADLLVLATGSERPRIADAVDRTAFLRGVPWLAVSVGPRELRVGPTVVPGRTPCHRCQERRRRQHSRRRLPAPTEVSPPAPEFAVLRQHVALAAALARQALADVADAGEQGRVEAVVRTVDLADGAVSSAHVVAVDGCDRCRGRFGPREVGRRALWDALESAAGATDDEAAGATDDEAAGATGVATEEVA
ncbi:MAG: TOMM precursor leader peptide-binding protein [Actinomycetaceae bacterium]